VILKDVLGYSLEEIGGTTESTIPAVKAALHRGREGLRAAVQEPDDRPPPTLSEAERARLSAYVERFNARDFDTVRDMLAEDVRLELVNKTRLKGRTEVGRYFGNYANARDWHFQLGFVDRRPAIIASDPSDSVRRDDGPHWHHSRLPPCALCDGSCGSHPPRIGAAVARHAARFVQKLINERTPMTNAFLLRLPSELSTPPPGLMTYCRSGCSIHHGFSCA
jgi:SnoaL-like domain